MTQVILVLNAGASSVKFFMFSIDELGLLLTCRMNKLLDIGSSHSYLKVSGCS
jgi:acetate kinase